MLLYVVPYKVLPDKTTPPTGPPSVWSKACRIVRPEPSVFTEKAVPKTTGKVRPPSLVVPYSVLPDRTKLQYGLSPSLLLYPKKSCTTKKPVPSVLILKTFPPPTWAPYPQVP